MDSEQLLALAVRPRDNCGRLLPVPLEARLWSKVEKRDTGCWIWTASANSNGYGNIGVDGRTRLTHRLIYEMLVGPIPVGLQLDHLCRNRLCCNPAHLEEVTPAENTRRGNAGIHWKIKSQAITRCPRGHLYTPENTYVCKRGKRSCRPCKRERDGRRDRRRAN